MNFTVLPRKVIRLGAVVVTAALLSGWGAFAPPAAATPQLAQENLAEQLAQQLAQENLAQAADDSARDPLESVNRAIFGFNDFLQRLLIRPMAELYVLMLPELVRDSIRNVLANIRAPVVLVNDILQGEGTRALETTQRFVINTTVGIGGIIDVADKMGIKGHNEDFGQTLAVWGVGEGFYLVLPILGPSNPRDGISKVADFYLDPVSQWADNTDREEITYTRTLLGGIDSFSRIMNELDKLKETSIDYYAAVRSITRQRRNAEIRNGKPADGAPLPDIRYDFNAELPAGN